MIASYVARLLLQVLSSAFLVHLLISILVCATTIPVVRFAERLRPATGARLLFVVRLSPLLAAIYVACAFAVPSYLRLESDNESERVGLCGAILATAAVSMLMSSCFRAFRAVSQTCRLTRTLERENHPCVVVSGLLNPRLLICQAAVDLFTPDELDVVLRHEAAHARSRDNLKRLFFLMLPDALPCVNTFASLDRAYKRLIECAADDFATAGDTRTAISLANALIVFARTRGRTADSALATSLIDDKADLAHRVRRLLAAPQQPARALGFCPSVLAVTAAALCLNLLLFVNLGAVHRALELLSR
jgi:Zn-dependent protease with chaperone function